MAQSVKEGKEEKFSSDRVLDLYANLTVEIWEIVSALIGEAILEFSFYFSHSKNRREVSVFEFSGSI